MFERDTVLLELESLVKNITGSVPSLVNKDHQERKYGRNMDRLRQTYII